MLAHGVSAAVGTCWFLRLEVGSIGDSGGLAIWPDFPGCICSASSSFLIRAGEVMAQSIKCFVAQA